MEKEIIFVTGNIDKLNEAKLILSDYVIKNIKIELTEHQGEKEDIIKKKAKLAAQKLGKPCFVDDTSLSFDALNGLPGVYIKTFLEKLGNKGLIKLIKGYDNKTAYATAMIGYCMPGKEPVCFEGTTKGKIVEPKGTKFGWDPIFMPEGYNQTYAEMDSIAKNKISHRKKALELFKKHLENEIFDR